MAFVMGRKNRKSSHNEVYPPIKSFGFVVRPNSTRPLDWKGLQGLVRCLVLPFGTGAWAKTARFLAQHTYFLFQSIAGISAKQLSPETNELKSSEDGFTLFEMLVVMTIVMMVFAGVSNTIVTRNSKPTVNDMAKNVQKLVYNARANAISSGKPQKVWINLDRKSFAYQQNKTVLLPDTVGLKITTGQEMISAEGIIELLFLADGSSSGMDILFSDENLVEGEAGSRRLSRLRVNWLTGLPSVLDVVTQ